MCVCVCVGVFVCECECVRVDSKLYNKYIPYAFVCTFL